MATPIKSIAAAPGGMVVHFFDTEHGQVVERPVAVIGLDAKGDIHPMILGKKLAEDEEDKCVGSRWLRADKFPDYCRIFCRTDETDDEDEEAFTRTIAENLGLIESEDEAEDDEDELEVEDDGEDGDEPRMSSGDL